MAAVITLDSDGFITVDGLRLPVKADVRRGVLLFKDKCKRRTAERRGTGQGGPNGDILELPVAALFDLFRHLS